MYLSLLLKYWKYLALIAAFLLIVWSIHHHGYSAGLNEGKRRGDKALIEQQITLTHECGQHKQLTSRIEDKNAKATANIDNEFDNYLMRDREEASIVTVTREAEPATASDQKLPKRNGLSIARLDLRLQAKKADKVLADYNSCLDTLDQVWSLYGQ